MSDTHRIRRGNRRRFNLLTAGAPPPRDARGRSRRLSRPMRRRPKRVRGRIYLCPHSRAVASFDRASPRRQAFPSRCGGKPGGAVEFLRQRFDYSHFDMPEPPAPLLPRLAGLV